MIGFYRVLLAHTRRTISMDIVQEKVALVITTSMLRLNLSILALGHGSLLDSALLLFVLVGIGNMKTRGLALAFSAC